MKTSNFILFMMIGITVLLLSSCSTSQTFTVQGEPGTVITTPQNQQIAVVDNSGNAQIKMKRKAGYYHYLNAQAPGSNLQVPFALDYKNKNRATKRGLIRAGEWTLFGASIISSISLGAMALANVEDATAAYIILGATSIGGAFGGLGLEFCYMDPIDSDYDYLKTQSTNSDLLR
ncbi:MAG: hypothetical protein J1F40_02750 [Prevotellaceae bacterium]|nr:hypothetical protein [Prevotellaceae bacterium]